MGKKIGHKPKIIEPKQFAKFFRRPTLVSDAAKKGGVSVRTAYRLLSVMYLYDLQVWWRRMHDKKIEFKILKKGE